MAGCHAADTLDNPEPQITPRVNARPRSEVERNCREYCDSHASKMFAACKVSCATYDETEGIFSCGCNSGMGEYDSACRIGCSYMDFQWKIGGTIGGWN